LYTVLYILHVLVLYDTDTVLACYIYIVPQQNSYTSENIFCKITPYSF